MAKNEAKYQHVVPQVYLKQFGFPKEFHGRMIPFVSVMNFKEGKWEDIGRQIDSFLGKHKIYNLSDCVELPNNFIDDKLNRGIEGRFPKIIKRLNSCTEISKDLHMAIAEITANFLCRSIWVLDWIKGWIPHENFRIFFDLITENTSIDKSKSDYYFSEIRALSEEDAIRYLMVYLTQHVSNIIFQASLTIIKGNDNFPFFTSDNPVILRNIGLGQLIDPKMEIYFPLSPNYLVYFYWDETTCNVNSLSKYLKNRAIINIDKEFYDFFHREILLEFVDNFIIAPFNIDKLR